MSSTTASSSGSSIGYLQQQFSDILLIQLKRQWIEDAEAWHAILHQAIKVPANNPIRLIFNYGQMNLSEKVVIAVVDAIMQLSTTSPPTLAGSAPTPTEWVLNLAGNKLTDKVADCVCLLLKSCAFMVRVDLSGNPLTEQALSKLNETASLMVKRPQLILPASTTRPPAYSRGGEGGSRGSGSHAGAEQRSAPLAAGPQGSGIHGGPTGSSQPGAPQGAASQTSGTTSSSNIDIAALRRRRDKLFHDEGLDSTEQAVATRDNLRHEVGAQPKQLKRTPSSSSLNQRTAGPPIAAAIPPAQPSHMVQQPQPQPGGQTKKAAEPRQPDFEESSTEGSASPSPAARVGTLDTSNGQIAESSIHHEGEEEEGSHAGLDRSSLASTTATETPDQHDYLDVTMNLGPLDKPLTLAGANLAPDSLLHPDRYRGITVVNIAQNNLEYIAGMPPSLIRLDASSNALTRIQGLESCPLLAVLNLRRNPMIKKIEGLDENLNLTHLFLGRNSISFVSNIGHLWMLEVLDLSFNKVSSERDIRPLSMNPVLRHLLLVGNPFHKSFGKHYKPVMRNICSSLLILDSSRLSYSRRSDASSRLDRSMGNLMLPQATHGVTGAPTGYAAPGKVNHSMSAIRDKEKEHSALKEKVLANKKRRVTREDVVAQLQRQNQAMIEQAVVERLARMQDSQQSDSTEQQQQEGVDENTAADNGGGDDDVFRGPSALSTAGGSLATFDQTAGQAAPNVVLSSAFEAETANGGPQHVLFGSGSVATTRRAPVDASEIFLRNVRLADSGLRPDDSLTTPQAADMSLTPIQGGTYSETHRNVYPDRAPPLSPTPDLGERDNSRAKRAQEETQINDENVLPAPRHGATKQQHRDAQKDQPYPLLGSSKRSGPNRHVAPTRESSPPSRQIRSTGGPGGHMMSPSLNGNNNNSNATAGSPDRHVKFSPIRFNDESGMNKTDVSVTAVDSRTSPQHDAVALWERQLVEDLSSARVALKTLLVVLEATGSPQRGGGRKQLNEPGADQQQRCLNIIRQSGMMSDTELPESVVKHYLFTEEELNLPASGAVPPKGASAVVVRRSDVLRQVQALGEAKTCLRYLVALVDNSRWDLVERYVSQLRQTSELL